MEVATLVLEIKHVEHFPDTTVYHLTDHTYCHLQVFNGCTSAAKAVSEVTVCAAQRNMEGDGDCRNSW
jgi:hypothetical protein